MRLPASMCRGGGRRPRGLPWIDLTKRQLRGTAIHVSLASVRGYAAAGRIVLTRHALQRMAQRGVRRGDVRCALEQATSCTANPGGNWRVEGPDLDGDALTLIVAIEDGVIVVTVF